MSYRYIDSSSALAECCQRWSALPLLAMDTEFIRTDTFYPIIGLYQVNDGEALYLLDPLVIDDWSPFQALMVNTAVVKLFHSCSEDLEVIQRHLGCVPQPLLDTQIGAALAGHRGSMSYQNLVMECLGIHVPKGETRSDWLRRPLSDSQCEYAALDVQYLPALYRQLHERLQTLDREAWWREEGQRVVDQALAPAALNEYYRKISSAWKLSQRQQAVLQQLCQWREQQARDSDVPRGRIIKDAICLEIAQRCPRSLGELGAVKELPAPAVRKYGDAMLAAVEAGLNAAESELPEALPRPPVGEGLKLMKSLQKRIRAIADLERMPPELLMAKRDLLEVMQADDWRDALSGWRRQLLAAVLADVLETP